MRDDIIQAMSRVDPQVTACRHGSTTHVSIVIWFAGSGRVCGVTVPPEIEHTPEGSCIAQAIRAAVVPAFAGPYFQIRFPFPFPFPHP